MHISAPSLGRDDARYRTQARGFLEFEPVEIHSLHEPDEDEGDGDEVELTGVSEQEDSDIFGHDQEWENSTPLDPRDQEAEDLDHGRYTKRSKRQCLDQRWYTERSKRQCMSGSVERELGQYGQGSEEQESTTPDYLTVKGREGFAIKKSKLHLRQEMEADCLSEERLSRLQEAFWRKTNTRPETKLKASVNLRRSHSPSPQVLQTPLLRKLGADIVTDIDSPTAPWTSVKETPHLLVARTPLFSKPQTSPTPQPDLTTAIPDSHPPQSDSWQPPPSTIPDSQPNIQSDSPILELSSSLCLKRPHQSSSPSPTHPPSTPMDPSQIQVPSSPSAEEMDHMSWEALLAAATSVPATPAPATPAPAVSAPAASSPAEDMDCVSWHSSDGIPYFEQHDYDESPPSPIKEPAVTVTLPTAAPSSNTNIAEPMVPNTPSQEDRLAMPPPPIPSSSSNTASSSTSALQPGEFLEIRSPPPVPGSSRLGQSHMTETFTLLANVLTFERGLIPFMKHPEACETYVTDNYERGHWLIPVHTWIPADKEWFWDKLKEHIEAGKCGWATQAYRELVEMNHGLETVRGKGDGTGLKEVIKIYCWSEVAREVWLMCYVDSVKKVSNIGAKYLNGNDEVVFDMI